MRTPDALDRAIGKASAFERVDFDEALALLNEAELTTLGSIAGAVRRKLHPKPLVTYIVDRNINYTNVCECGCLFCAFHRKPGEAGGYVISETDLVKKIEETIALGGIQILLQGGMNPDLDMEYYIGLLKFIKSNFDIHVHGFSPPEIFYLSEKSGLSATDVIRRLAEAGLGSIPGGGAEILVDEVRRKISPRKCSSAAWLDVMRQAHRSNLRSTATMMFGCIEKPEHIVEHLMKIRDLQDETGGFTAFIPWSFQPENTRLDVDPATAAEYLRLLSVSRIVLDNVDNVQASWVTQGAKIAQVALAFGANDLGSTMIEENVVAAAGVRFRLPEKEMRRLVRDAGFVPARRDCFYSVLSDGDAESPRLRAPASLTEGLNGRS